MSAPAIRILQPADQPALDRYLALRPMTTMFLRGNLLATGGLDCDPTERYGGIYAGVCDGEEILGAAAHFWNDNVILESDTHQAELVRAVVEGTGRGINGFLGPAPQVGAAIEELKLTVVKPKHHSAEILYSLDLDQLRVPAALEAGRVECRRGSEADRDLRIDWGMAFMAEAMDVEDTPESRAYFAGRLESGDKTGSSFILYADGRPVSISGFNTRVPDCVQIGGVFTPPELRGRGYGRAVVAGSLLLARESSVTRSVLFTESDNLAAQRAYEALGYKQVGNYALVFFNERQRLT